MNIQLKFWNLSNTPFPPDVVILQKNSNHNESVIETAWKVIKHCSYGCYHPFIFCQNMEVTVSDECGNYSPHLNASPGKAFAVEPLLRGRRLFRQGRAHHSNEIQVSNKLMRGALDMHFIRSGLVIASSTAVAPGQKAIYIPSTTICIGVIPNVVEGQRLEASIVSGINTELSLNGVASADIIMIGGSSDTDSTAFEFRMENIVPRHNICGIGGAERKLPHFICWNKLVNKLH